MENILKEIFILLPESCPGGWDLVMLGGVKNFSVGIYDGTSSTVRSSMNFECS